jgi:hypothetical protein
VVIVSVGARDLPVVIVSNGATEPPVVIASVEATDPPALIVSVGATIGLASSSHQIKNSRANELSSRAGFFSTYKKALKDTKIKILLHGPCRNFAKCLTPFASSFKLKPL